MFLHACSWGSKVGLCAFGADMDRINTQFLYGHGAISKDAYKSVVDACGDPAVGPNACVVCVPHPPAAGLIIDNLSVRLRSFCVPAAGAAARIRPEAPRSTAPLSAPRRERQPTRAWAPSRSTTTTTREKFYHYWFVASEGDPHTDPPVALWLIAGATCVHLRPLRNCQHSVGRGGCH